MYTKCHRVLKVILLPAVHPITLPCMWRIRVTVCAWHYWQLRVLTSEDACWLLVKKTALFMTINPGPFIIQNERPTLTCRWLQKFRSVLLACHKTSMPVRNYCGVNIWSPHLHGLYAYRRCPSVLKHSSFSKSCMQQTENTFIVPL